jgi:CheY-like chemotaxis protein
LNFILLYLKFEWGREFMSDVEDPMNPSSWVALVVDDRLDNLEVVVKVLLLQGAQVHAAHDGIEGLQVLERVKPTFILLDLSMPRMDGWTMLSTIRRDALAENVPIIALTAHGMVGDEDRVREAGFDAYIAKPFTVSVALRPCPRRKFN